MMGPATIEIWKMYVLKGSDEDFPHMQMCVWEREIQGIWRMWERMLLVLEVSN
jgi:hypothetical protein